MSSRVDASLCRLYSFASKTTLLDILVSRRCYTEKEHRFTRKILCNIGAFHLRNICAKKYPVVWSKTYSLIFIYKK